MDRSEGRKGLRRLVVAGLLAASLAGAVAGLAMAEPGSASKVGANDAGRAGTALTVHSSRYGQVLFDGRGFALYAFTRDRRGRSVCTGACAKEWPPLLAHGRPQTAAGLEKSLVATTRRADGSLQVTYAGRPLYYYRGDRKPGQIGCQNVRLFGGLWLVVQPSGGLVR
jgi:predicted lipoprotein with Yx(FWY)xxD motif